MMFDRFTNPTSRRLNTVSSISNITSFMWVTPPVVIHDYLPLLTLFGAVASLHHPCMSCQQTSITKRDVRQTKEIAMGQETME